MGAPRVKTNFRIVGAVVKAGTKMSFTVGTSGIVLVSTGLASPNYALAQVHPSTSGGVAITQTLKTYKCSGSYAMFRAYSTSPSSTVISGSYVAFDWMAWES